MRLSTRLSLYFVGTVALILVVFSATLYGVASKYLHRQADERLEAALNTLMAAAEVNEDGVEWEPSERRLTFGRRTVEGQFHWMVADDRGRRIDGSTPTEFEPSWPSSMIVAPHPKSIKDPAGHPWRFMARRLEPSRPGGVVSPNLDHNSPGEAGRTHRSIILEAAVSLSGVRETLRTLALMLAALSIGTWLVTLLVGGRLCRRALRPVTEMAQAAHAIAGDEFDERLPTPTSLDELEELGRAFNGLLDRRRESHERQRKFTGDASHQFRTPLTAMQGQVDLALRQPRSVEEYRRVLGVVQGKTRHLRRIVEALLFLARADAESQRPQLEPIELTGWLAEHIDAWTGPRPDDLLLGAGDSGPVWVRAHPTLLGELLDNLLDNACKYSEAGTPIVVKASLDGNFALLSVADGGIGIERESVSEIMNPFYRAPQARSRTSKGLGLGLSVASRIAGIFGGRLEVSSQPGSGSTFSLILPAQQSPRESPRCALGLRQSRSRGQTQ